MADFPASIPALTRPTSSDPGTGGGATDATVIVDRISDEVEAIATELGTTPSGASATVAARLDALDTTVSGKAASAHAHATTDVTGLAESVRDTIGTALVAGANVTVTVDDAGDTITIASTASGGLTAEQVMDTVATMLTAGSNISLTYSDAGDTLTVAVTGLGDAAALSAADIDERARDAVGTALVAGSGITITPNDGGDTITIAATGGGSTSPLTTKGDIYTRDGSADARLAVGTTGQIFVADSAATTGVKWADQAPVLNGTGAPSSGTGTNGAMYLRTGDNTGVAGQLIGPKSGGAWPTSLGTVGRTLYLAERTASQSPAPIPGWRSDLVSGATPSGSDLNVGGLSYTTNGIHATSAGTTGYACAKVYSNAIGSGQMAFFTVRATVNALPEATRTFRMGRLGYSGGSIYGIAIEVDSSGNFAVKSYDPAAAGTITLASGGTGITAGMSIYLAVYGWEFRAWRCASGSYVKSSEITGAMPLDSEVGFAALYGIAAFGVATNANSVRVDPVTFYG